MISMEIYEPTFKETIFDENTVKIDHLVQLDMIHETQKYNLRVIQRDFQVGDLVLKKAQSNQIVNKLPTKWV